jgi:hypothetical protein
MAGQFDLFMDPDGGLLVVLQHDVVDSLETRIFASCLPASAVPLALQRLAVPFWFGDAEYCVMVHLLGTARLGRMGRKVGSVTQLRDSITRALDLLYSGT